MTDTSPPSSGKPRIGLFVTCLADLFRPSVAFAAVKLLQDAGCILEVPSSQTCCGQPAYNSGDNKNARQLARNVIRAFEDFDYVVAPSGSCAGMIRVHYPKLLQDDAEYAARAQSLADKSFELTSFLTDVMGVKAIAGKLKGIAAYHDSCAGLRELGVRAQPRQLLAGIEGLSLKEAAEPDACCGFGGTFSVKYPDISGAIVSEKAAQLTDTGASLVLGGDLGCLMNIAGRLKRLGSEVQVRHVAEILAGDMDTPAIGEGE